MYRQMTLVTVGAVLVAVMSTGGIDEDSVGGDEEGGGC
jgi:hypothetical protein